MHDLNRRRCLRQGLDRHFAEIGGRDGGVAGQDGVERIVAATRQPGLPQREQAIARAFVGQYQARDHFVASQVQFAIGYAILNDFAEDAFDRIDVLFGIFRRAAQVADDASTFLKELRPQRGGLSHSGVDQFPKQPAARLIGYHAREQPQGISRGIVAADAWPNLDRVLLM